MQIFHICWDRGGKSITLSFYPHLFLQRKFCYHDNGATRGIDSCLDRSWWFFGFRFNFTDFNFWRWRNDCLGKEFFYDYATKTEKLKYKCGQLYDIVEGIHDMIHKDELVLKNKELDKRKFVELLEKIDEEIISYHSYMINIDLEP